MRWIIVARGGPTIGRSCTGTSLRCCALLPDYPSDDSPIGAGRTARMPRFPQPTLPGVRSSAPRRSPANRVRAYPGRSRRAIRRGSCGGREIPERRTGRRSARLRAHCRVWHRAAVASRARGVFRSARGREAPDGSDSRRVHRPCATPRPDVRPRGTDIMEATYTTHVRFHVRTVRLRQLAALWSTVMALVPEVRGGAATFERRGQTRRALQRFPPGSVSEPRPHPMGCATADAGARTVLCAAAPRPAA